MFQKLIPAYLKCGLRRR